MYSLSEDDLDVGMDTVEADGELQIITEMWVEPQFGMVVNSTPERKHLDGLDYRQLALAVSTIQSQAIVWCGVAQCSPVVCIVQTAE